MKANSSKQIFVKLLTSEFFILIMSAIYYVIIGAISPRMFSGNMIKNIFQNMWPLLAGCLGQTFVLLLGGIDLSQTSVISLCSIVAGILLGGSFQEIKFSGSPLWGSLIKESGGVFSGLPDITGTILTVIIVLLVGTLIGCINGLFVAKLNMPPFMITLISQMLWAAIALWLVCSQNCTGLNASFNFLGKGTLAGYIYMPFLIVIILLVLCELLLSKTVFGKWIYCVGSNSTAAVVSGVPKNRIIISVYSLSGFCAAVASILYTGRQMMGRPTIGDGMLNDILGATVIGGVSMYGGKGKAIWALYGVLFYCIMTTSMNMLHLNSFLTQAVKGIIILLAVSLDVVRTSIQQKMTK